VHDQPAVEHAARQALKPPRHHADKRPREPKFAPTRWLDSGTERAPW
jgi:hypothetical protein